MAPLGTVSEEEMVAQFARQARALATAGADGVVIETMTDLGEAKAALRAVKEATGLPVVVSMTYDSGPGGFATMMGVRPDQAARELQSAGADIVGANCGSGIAEMVEVARLVHGATSLPVWCKPNAGLPELVDGKTVFRQSPEEMVRHLPVLIEAGASIVGGCCGTTPEHIRLLVTECANIVAAARAHIAFFPEPEKGQG
jgi:5-methyltetrahydrofolate--homocysteine methyltransferase